MAEANRFLATQIVHADHNRTNEENAIRNRTQRSPHGPTQKPIRALDRSRHTRVGDPGKCASPDHVRETVKCGCRVHRQREAVEAGHQAENDKGNAENGQNPAGHHRDKTDFADGAGIAQKEGRQDSDEVGGGTAVGGHKIVCEITDGQILVECAVRKKNETNND